MAVKKQVILPMEEYERLMAAQPEKIVETRTEYVSMGRNMGGTIMACISCGLSVAGLFWGWGWWDAFPIVLTIGAIGSMADGA